MPNSQFSLFDAADVIDRTERVVVERIYVSKGDDTYDHDGRIADRFAGVLIEDQIYWINKTFATFTQLALILQPLNIRLFSTGEWGNIECNKHASMRNKVTKVTKSHSTFFSEDSMYLNKAKFFTEDKIWWYPEDIKTHFNGRFDVCSNTNDCECGENNRLS